MLCSVYGVVILIIYNYICNFRKKVLKRQSFFDEAASTALARLMVLRASLGDEILYPCSFHFYIYIYHICIYISYTQSCQYLFHLNLKLSKQQS